MKTLILKILQGTLFPILSHNQHFKNNLFKILLILLNLRMKISFINPLLICCKGQKILKRSGSYNSHSKKYVYY